MYIYMKVDKTSTTDTGEAGKVSISLYNISVEKI